MSPPFLPRPIHHTRTSPQFLEILMPMEAHELHAPAYAFFRRTLLELPFVGIPGLTNFLDA